MAENVIARLSGSLAKVEQPRDGGSELSKCAHRSSSACCARQLEEDLTRSSSDVSGADVKRTSGVGHRRGRSAEPRLEKLKNVSCIVKGGTGTSSGTPAGTFLEVPPTRSELANLRETIPEVDEGKSPLPSISPDGSQERRRNSTDLHDSRFPLTSGSTGFPDNHTKFQSLQRLLTQNSIKRANQQGSSDPRSLSSSNDQTGSTTTGQGHLSPSRQVVIFDSVLETAVPGATPTVEDAGSHRRIVSVDREELLRKEAVALSVERDPGPGPQEPQQPPRKQLQSVTVSRSRTWSFPDKLMQSVERRKATKPKSLGLRQTSLTEEAGDHGRTPGPDRPARENEVRPIICILDQSNKVIDGDRSTEETVSREHSQRISKESSLDSEDEENSEINYSKTDEDSGEIRRSREVVIHRDSNGYGLTVTGDNPVYVQSVRDNGAAHRSGVQKGDQIIRVNGTLVANSNHIEVVKLIKSNSFATLTLVSQEPTPEVTTVDQAVQPTKDSRETGSQKSDSSQFIDSDEAQIESQKSSSIQKRNHKRSSSSISSIPQVHHLDRKISGPQAVNHDKDMEFKLQKVATIQMMFKQVQEEYEKMKQDYRRNPTEKLQLRLEVKTQMLRRVEDQLRTLSAELAAAQLAPGATNGKVESPPVSSWNDSRRGSSTGIGLPPNGKRKNRKRHEITSTGESINSGEMGESMSDVDVFRSPVHHSDSSRWSDESAALSSGANTPSREYATLPGFKSTGPVSIRTPLSSFGQEQVAGSPPTPITQANVISIEDDDYSIDDNKSNDAGIFGDLVQLKSNPAHLAVFLHYLISNSEPSALLFLLVTETYPTGTMKELRKWAYEIYSSFMVEQAPLKLNVDDSVVFSVENTLKLKFGKEEAMRNVFVDARKIVELEINYLLADFRSKRALGLGSIYGDHELRDSMDRSTELRIIDQSLWKHFERFAQDEASERSQALASALATVFKQVGLTAIKTSSLIDRVPVFVAKDRKVFKFSKTNKKAYYIKGHSFVSQHYFTLTTCQQCNKTIGGVGNQGYQCTNCDMNLHPLCKDQVQDVCSTGSLRKKKEKRSSSVFDKIISRKPSMNLSSAAKENALSYRDDVCMTPSTAVIFRPSLCEDQDITGRQSFSALSNRKGLHKPTESAKSDDDTLTHRDFSPPDDESYNRVRSESLNQRPELRTGVRRAHSDNLVESQIQSMEPIVGSSESSSNSSLSINGGSGNNSDERLDEVTRSSSLSFQQKSQFNDSDMETETDLMPLEAVIQKELIRKLKPKEKKRQEVLNELFCTERAHVRNLKVMYRLIYRPMLLSSESSISSDLVNLLFPNLDDVIHIHVALNNDFKARKSENSVVGDIGHILLNHFSGEAGKRLKTVSAKFCQHQSYALEVLRQRQRKDQKLSLFLQEVSSHPLCRRLELKDLIPTVMQRLTKYPLLIENLLKYTICNTDEYDLLVRAHECSKEILNFVNTRVQECEDHQKLVDLQRRLDKRPIENSPHPGVAEFKKLDLTRHKMIYDGELTWRISRNKQIDLHVVLLEDILVLLQRQDDRLVMRCQSTNVASGKEDLKLTHSPVIKLGSLLARNVATDNRAIFLVSTSDYGPQIYELVASSKDEKSRWLKHITDTTDSYKNKDAAKVKKLPSSAADSPAVQLSPVDEMLTMERVLKTGDNEHSRRQETDDATDRRLISRIPQQQQQQQPDCGQDPIGRVEVVQFEASQLVQPNEVKVSLMQVVDKEEASTDPVEVVKEKNRTIEAALTEKKNLLARILQIPNEEFDHISEFIDEIRDQGDIKELILSSLTQADRLTRLISEQLDSNLLIQNDADEIQDTSETDDTSQRTPTSSPKLLLRSNALDKSIETPLAHHNSPSFSLSPASGHPGAGRQATGPVAKEIPIVVSSSQLMAISDRLHDNLTQLMNIISTREKDGDENQSEGLGGGGVGDRSSERPIVLPSMSYQPETTQPLANKRGECIASMSVVDPIMTERLEVIEPETFVIKPAYPATNPEDSSTKTTQNRTNSSTRIPS